MKLVIKGALYTDGSSLLIPHFTGEYWLVDCDIFLNKEDFDLMEYSKEYIKNNKDNFIDYDMNRYFYAESGPEKVDKNFTLISDISSLSINHEDYETI